MLSAWRSNSIGNRVVTLRACFTLLPSSSSGAWRTPSSARRVALKRRPEAAPCQSTPGIEPERCEQGVARRAPDVSGRETNVAKLALAQGLELPLRTLGGDPFGDRASDASEQAPERAARAGDRRIERTDLPGPRRRGQTAGRCDFHTECPFDLLRDVTLRVVPSPMTDGSQDTRVRATTGALRDPSRDRWGRPVRVGDERTARPTEPATTGLPLATQLRRRLQRQRSLALDALSRPSVHPHLRDACRDSDRHRPLPRRVVRAERAVDQSAAPCTDERADLVAEERDAS